MLEPMQIKRMVSPLVSTNIYFVFVSSENPFKIKLLKGLVRVWI